MQPARPRETWFNNFTRSLCVRTCAQLECRLVLEYHSTFFTTRATTDRHDNSVLRIVTPDLGITRLPRTRERYVRYTRKSFASQRRRERHRLTEGNVNSHFSCGESKVANYVFSSGGIKSFTVASFPSRIEDATVPGCRLLFITRPSVPRGREIAD